MMDAVLPTGSQRIMAIVKRSAPRKDRPRISAEFEDQLAAVDAESAACYASMEDLSDKIEQVVDRIESDGVVMESMDEDDDSVVTHISEVRREIHNGQARLTAAAAAVPRPRSVTEG